LPTCNHDWPKSQAQDKICAPLTRFPFALDELMFIEGEPDHKYRASTIIVM
jgi:hypothetical protein